MNIMNRYYCYRHIRLDTNQVFYVGVGTTHYPTSKTNTKLYHRAYVTDRRSSYWKRIVAKTAYRVEIFWETNDYNEVIQKEIEFISLYKRVKDGGTLCNMTLGGEGVLGHTPSEETRGKISDSKKGKKRTEETKKKISESHKGKQGCNNLKVLLIEENKIFKSIKDCAKYLKVTPASVSDVIYHRIKTVKGKTVVKYLENGEIIIP